MSNNKKMSSKSLASRASRVMRDSRSSAIKKSLAAGVLSQRSPSKQTGKAMEAKASKVLKSNKYSNETKSYAASLVSQSKKER